jgi:spore coat polysaccharide biosynthesis protein SpsF (cytidylyltransferase family)
MKIVAVVQARMGSTRLYGKSLLPLAGKPIVWHVLNRLTHCKSVDEVVLSIPNSAEDEFLSLLAASLDLKWVYASHENDLVIRHYEIANTEDADIIVRVPGDNPCVDPSVVDKTVYFSKRHNLDFCSSFNDVFTSGWPEGVGCEVWKYQALESLYQIQNEDIYREHPHLNVRKFDLKSAPFKASKEFYYPDISVDVNTREDYEKVSKLYKEYSWMGRLFNTEDIIKYFKKVKK